MTDRLPIRANPTRELFQARMFRAYLKGREHRVALGDSADGEELDVDWDALWAGRLTDEIRRQRSIRAQFSTRIVRET